MSYLRNLIKQEGVSCGKLYSSLGFLGDHYMKKPSVTQVKKYLAGLSSFTKKKAKYVTAERLSSSLGIYPEKISEDLSYFDPIIKMDYTYNLLDLVPTLEEYVSDPSNKKEVKQVKEVVTKKKLAEYDSISDFIYKKMSNNGLIDRNAELSDADLRALKRLINQEEAERKKKRSK